MKKVIGVLLLAAMIVSLAACGSSDTPEQDTSSSLIAEVASMESENTPRETSETESIENNKTEQDSKILIAYFSRVGNTEWEDGVDVVTSASLNDVDGEYAGNAQLLAQMAQQATGGDLFLIQTEASYPSDYRETTDQAKVEQNENARPALATHVENMDSYDTIVLIYPNWWGALPQPVCTFLEEYDFAGKTILPLCTHAGSQMGSSEYDIESLCPKATVLDGLAVSGSSAASAQSDVENWLNNAGISK